MTRHFARTPILDNYSLFKRTSLVRDFAAKESPEVNRWHQKEKKKRKEEKYNCQFSLRRGPRERKESWERKKVTAGL